MEILDDFALKEGAQTFSNQKHTKKQSRRTQSREGWNSFYEEKTTKNGTRISTNIEFEWFVSISGDSCSLRFSFYEFASFVDWNEGAQSSCAANGRISNLLGYRRQRMNPGAGFAGNPIESIEEGIYHRGTEKWKIGQRTHSNLVR
jgi:hypothetical protein